MIHKKYPKVAVMQDAVTSAYATSKREKKKIQLCLGLDRTPEILYAALGLKINPSTSAVGQRRFFFFFWRGTALLCWHATRVADNEVEVSWGL